MLYIGLTPCALSLEPAITNSEYYVLPQTYPENFLPDFSASRCSLHIAA
jgi:hypothetical protein